MMSNQKSKEAANFRRRVALLVSLAVHLGLLCMLVYQIAAEKSKAKQTDQTEIGQNQAASPRP